LEQALLRLEQTLLENFMGSLGKVSFCTFLLLQGSWLCVLFSLLQNDSCLVYNKKKRNEK